MKLKFKIVLLLVFTFILSTSIVVGSSMKAPIKGKWIPKTIVKNNGEVTAKLIITPTENLDKLTIKIKVPDNITLDNNIETYFELKYVKANIDIEIPISFIVKSAKESAITASAIVADLPTYTLGKSFLLLVNPSHEKEVKPRIITGKNGNKYSVY